MKTLLITRHAKSDWADGYLTDHQRPINKRGRRAAPKVAAVLLKHGWVPEVIVTSDATRALETAKLLHQRLSPRGILLLNPNLYHAGFGEIQECISALSADIQTLMLVGHNPGWEVSAGLLSGEQLSMTTCNVACLTHPASDWSGIFQPGTWTLQTMIRPKEI